MDLVSEGNSSVVIRNFAGGAAVCARKGDAVVDIKDTGSTARGEDKASSGDLVVLGIDLTSGPDSASSNGSLRGGGCSSILREIVGGEEGSSNASVKLGVTVIGAIDYGELEAAWIIEGQM